MKILDLNFKWICRCHLNLNHTLHTLTKSNTPYIVLLVALPGEEFNKCIYHFSNKTTHGSTITLAVINDIIEMFPNNMDVLRVILDDCFAQYKSTIMDKIIETNSSFHVK